MQFPKTLLLSRTLPGVGHVGEIILADIVRRMGLDRVHCVAPVSPNYCNQPDPELIGLSIRTIVTDQLEAKRWGSGKWGAVGSVFNYCTGFRAEVARCVREVIIEGQNAQVDQIFAVLESPLTFALAHRVAADLRVPLVTLVWDPPEYLVQTSGYDRWSRKSLLREFQRSLASSHRIGVVSETMRRSYSAFTSAPVQILRLGLPVPNLSIAQLPCHLPSNEWLIGFAGSMYANDAWKSLLNALDQVNWKVAKRNVRIRVLSDKVTMSSRRDARIDYLGFRSPEEVQDILTGCHLTYLPQPFSQHQRELCRFAFPTKLANYLALGRPVFVHAPEEGALSEFVKHNLIGSHAASLEPTPILVALEQLLLEPLVYEAVSENVLKVARKYFDRSVFHSAVDSLLGTEATVVKPCAASQAS